jgi:hypothetical protein
MSYVVFYKCEFDPRIYQSRNGPWLSYRHALQDRNGLFKEGHVASCWVEQHAYALRGKILEKNPMPGKKRFTPKQDRQAKHIADSEKKRGMSAKRAKSIGYATVNKRKAAKKRKK